MSINERPTQADAIIAVRLPVDLRDALRAEAEAHQRSMSGQVRWLIDKSLATHEAAEGTPPSAADEIGRQAA